MQRLKESDVEQKAASLVVENSNLGKNQQNQKENVDQNSWNDKGYSTIFLERNRPIWESTFGFYGLLYIQFSLLKVGPVIPLFP